MSDRVEIKSLKIEVQDDPDSYFSCMSYLGKFAGWKDSSGQFYLNMAEGTFCTPGGETLASGCEFGKRLAGPSSYPLILPAQHLPHSSSNWDHCRDKIDEAFEGAQKEGHFKKYGIEPDIDADHPKEFWMDVLYAVQDCERVATHEMGLWNHVGVIATATLKLTDDRGNEWDKDVSASVWGCDGSDDGEYVDSMKREQLGILASELENDWGFPRDVIVAAAHEHLPGKIAVGAEPRSETEEQAQGGVKL